MIGLNANRLGFKMLVQRGFRSVMILCYVFTNSFFTISNPIGWCINNKSHDVFFHVHVELQAMSFRGCQAMIAVGKRRNFLANRYSTFIPSSSSKIDRVHVLHSLPSLKQRARTWKIVVGRRSFPFGAR